MLLFTSRSDTEPKNILCEKTVMLRLAQFDVMCHAELFKRLVHKLVCIYVAVCSQFA